MAILASLRLGTALLLLGYASVLQAQSAESTSDGLKILPYPPPETTGTKALDGKRIEYRCAFNPEWRLRADFKGSSVTVECTGPWRDQRRFTGDLQPMDEVGLVLRGVASVLPNAESLQEPRVSYYFQVDGLLAGITWFAKKQPPLFTKWAYLPERGVEP